MKAQLLMLSAAGLLATASVAQAATDHQLHDFIDHAHQTVQTSLDTARVNLDHRVAVSAYVASNGRVGEVRISASSGSAQTDALVADAIRRVRLTHIPADLADAQLTIFLDPAGPRFAQVD